MSQNFDVIVIGAGPGGYVAAIRAAQEGFKTAIIEGHRMGGECLNYGCIPSKALITSGHLIDKIRDAGKQGIHVPSLEVDLAKMIDWKGGIVKQLTGGIAQLLKANGVTAFQGTGKFDGFASETPAGKPPAKKVKVVPYEDSWDGAAVRATTDDVVLTADRVIIATGSEIMQPGSLKIDGKHLLGSRDALEVRDIPAKIVVIGGGFIGMEIGTFFSKLDTEVLVVEATSQILAGTDRECVDVVQKKLVKAGVEIRTETKVLSVKGNAEGTHVEIETKDGKKEKVHCDWALLSVGRRPRTKNLNLSAIGLETTDRGFIPVNARLETSVPGVFAIGDVVGGAMLAHKASKEGLICVEGFKNPGVQMDSKALPWAIFVDPEIATVGHTEESARAAGWDPVVGKCPFAANGRALTTGEFMGFVKLIADRKTDRLLGAHMVGPEVSNLIAEVAGFIEMGATSADVARTIHAHPTLPETVMEAAENIHGMAIHFFDKKKPARPAELQS
jgi:dihydrolipoamide dehydrogenase